MGCGGAYGHLRPAEATPVFEPVSTMICDMCSVKFTLINRKVRVEEFYSSITVYGF